MHYFLVWIGLFSPLGFYNLITNGIIFLFNTLLGIYITSFIVKAQRMPRDIENFPALTGLWIENKNDRHFFINIENRKTWIEYLNDTRTSAYRLHMYNESNVLLQNIRRRISHVILTPNGYASGPFRIFTDPNLSTKLIPGYWHSISSFPNGEFSFYRGLLQLF